jgi:DNA-binding transcriptional LysR family regulator
LNPEKGAECRVQELAATLSNIGETLTVTAPHALCRPLVIPALTKIKEEHPNLSIRLIADDHLVNLVKNKVDVAIRVTVSGPQSAVISRLGKMQESLYGSKSYIKSCGGKPTDFSTLEQWQHISNEWQGIPVSYSLKGNNKITVSPNIRCNSVQEVLEFVIAGHGIALIPNILVTTYEQEEQLVELFKIAETPIYALHQFDQRVPMKVKEFITILRARIKQFN